MRSKLLALIFAVVVSGTSLAEESEFIEMEPIIVTASRGQEGLSQASANAGVVSESDIEAATADGVPELLKDSEGVYFYDSSGIGAAGRVNMRGFWGGMSTHQLVLVDGVPQNKAKDMLVDWDEIPLESIERIEVIRGPVSALYGDNAMSGVINIITKSPGLVPEAKLSAAYGSYNTQNYSGSFSGTHKKIGYRLGLGAKTSDGFRRHNNYRNVYFNGKLDFSPSEEDKLRLSLDYSRKRQGASPWALTQNQIDSDRRQARPGSENDSSQQEKADVSLSYSRDINESISIEATPYYRYDNSDSFYTRGASENTTREQLDRENTAGLLLRSNIDLANNQVTVGVDLEESRFDYEEYNASFQVRGNIRQDYRVKRDVVGPYLQDKIKLWDLLNLILGLRYDFVEFDFVDYQNNGASSKKKMTKLTPKFGLVYDYAANSNLYFNWAQGFRTPAIGQLFTYGSSANIDLNPEEAVNYEIGLRHKFNDKLKTNGTFYWMDVDNEIAYDYAASQYMNYGKTRHYGIEAGVDFDLIEKLEGFANYAYTSAKNKNGVDKGKYLTNIPIQKASLGLRFKSDFGLKVNLTFSYVGSSYIDGQNQDKLDAYSTVDTKFTYDLKKWSFFLDLKNLFDHKYNSYGFRSGSTNKFSPAPGINFNLGASLKF